VQLRLTRRALEDLDLSIEQYAGRPATDYREAHVFVTAFVLAAMVPVEITIADLEFGGSFPREGGSRPNEIVVCWRSF
jgi:hypothetical protein